MVSISTAAAKDLSIYRTDFPQEVPDAPWFETAFEYLRDPAFEWTEYWAEVQRLAKVRVNVQFTTFTVDGVTHEAVGLDWSDVEEILGRAHSGTPEDDGVLLQTIVDEGAPAWVTCPPGVTDDVGWYLLGPFVAEPMDDDALENGEVRDFVEIDDECFAVDTVKQIDAVARMLHRLGLDEQPVFRGPAPDTIKLSMVIVPRA